MAYSVREERQSLATILREELAEAERAILQLHPDNVESFLRLLDSIDEHFAQLESSGLDLRPEQTRWTSLHAKMRREAGRVTRVLETAGGLKNLREANPPAQGMWWHLDAVVATSRRRFFRRLSLAAGTVASFLGIVWALFTFVIPADANTVIASEAITALRELTLEERWEDSLKIVEEARPQLTQPNIELLIWEAVVREHLGHGERVKEVLAEAQALVPSGQQADYWWTLGSIWLAVGDLEEACTAGKKALELDPSDPKGHFLLGNIADVEGDMSSAMELFQETFDLAFENNTQLAVVARIRMGMLLQRPESLPYVDEGQPAADEFCSSRSSR